MVETCHFCEEVLEWVAYGSCGHRHVCSTCIARYRFISRKFQCYYCQAERDVVFVTRAGDLGVVDFSGLPLEPREGQVGAFWYNEDTKAFFDDFNEYTRISEMCRFKCTSCDETNFNCIGDLMIHLYERHRLYMCTVCLLWRELFIFEQKLFTMEQLTQHITTGDSEVDETQGFTGHPYCGFCKNPFYGDEEIFIHVSTGPCSCHICLWLRPDFRLNGVEDHFFKNHIGADDGYWGATFSIVKAFHTQDELELHVNEHLENIALQSQASTTDGGDSAQYSSDSPLVSIAENKDLSEEIRKRLFKALKVQSGNYGNGLINARVYLKYLKSHGLYDLVPELARFCRDLELQKRLIDTYKSCLRGNDRVASSLNTRSLEQHFDSPVSDVVQSRREMKAFSEKIRDRLLKDFEETLGVYCGRLLDARSYFEYLESSGLSELVPKLAASFCAEYGRDRELMDAYNASLKSSQASVMVEHNSDS